MAAAAPARKAPPARAKPARRLKTVPARRPAPRKPTRGKPPARGRAAPARRAAARGGQLLPLAAGRAAYAVRGLPDSGLMVRLTRGRSWIALLGVLLAGIVALNVATLSLTSSSGRFDEDIRTLQQENTVLETRLAQRLSSDRVAAAATRLRMAIPGTDEISYRVAGRGTIRDAARRLAALAAAE